MLSTLVNSTRRTYTVVNQSLTPASTASRGTNTRGPSFSFAIPYDQTQACNIFGPTCQTGSIVVGVGPISANDGANVTGTTTLSCSDYLTAQSSYLARFTGFPGQNLPYFPTSWATLFGRSPECTSYARVRQERGSWTFSNCRGHETVDAASYQNAFLPPQIPPGVLRHHEFADWNCCGNCSIAINEVRLYYFPERGANESCPSNQTGTLQARSSSGSITKRANSLLDSSTMVLSGYTLCVT